MKTTTIAFLLSALALAGCGKPNSAGQSEPQASTGVGAPPATRASSVKDLKPGHVYVTPMMQAGSSPARDQFEAMKLRELQRVAPVRQTPASAAPSK